MKSLPQFASFMLFIMGPIGRKDFPVAIRALEDHLARAPSDTAAMGMLASCHRWSGAEDKAIEVGECVLRIDPRDFRSLKLLSEILANRGEHKRAVDYVRRGLEQFPEEMAPVAPFLVSLGKLAMRVLRPRRPIVENEIEPWKQINADNREWFEWAKQYLAWFGGSTGSSSLPVLH